MIVAQLTSHCFSISLPLSSFALMFSIRDICSLSTLLWGLGRGEEEEEERSPTTLNAWFIYLHLYCKNRTLVLDEVGACLVVDIRSQDPYMKRMLDAKFSIDLVNDTPSFPFAHSSKSKFQSMFIHQLYALESSVFALVEVY